jgi:hypothetical protein
MLCSPIELGLGEDASGLLILSPDAKIGAPIGDLFPADTILDVEITPNRGDLLSHFGLAREIAALTAASFRAPKAFGVEAATQPPEAARPGFQIPLRSPTVTSRGPSTSLRSARDDRTTVLITFWVAVPPKTEPRKFFDFLQQQGYLRVWIDNRVVRVDEAVPKTTRLGARVQVIQDRIAVTEENRPRLIEAIETALRFGKGKVNAIPIGENVQRPTDHGSAITDHEFPFSTGWHCAWCDLDIRPPTPGLFSFNNPLGACPECRGFGRTIAIDLNKAIPDRSLSIKQGVVRVFRGAEFGESQKDLLRACVREDIDINVPFEELPKADQDFVVEGKSVAGGGDPGITDAGYNGAPYKSCRARLAFSTSDGRRTIRPFSA